MDTRPWSAIPAKRSSADSLKLRRRVIYGFLTVILLSGPAACTIATGAVNTANEAVQANADLSQAAAAAQTVAWSFLAGEGSPIATVDSVDPTLGSGPTPVPFGNVDSLSYAGTALVDSPDEGSTQTWQVSAFWVQSGGVTYKLSITTAAGDGGPVLAATPSMSRVITAPGSAEGLDFSTLSEALPASQYQGLLQRVTIWAEAYGAGDIDRLAELSQNGPTYTVALGSAATNDTEAVIYEPSNVEIVSVIPTESGELYSAQVSVAFTNPANGFTMVNNYDLLVDLLGEGGDLSVIQQWGPTGQFVNTSP